MELKNIQIVHNVIKYTSNTTTWTRIYPRSIAVKKGHVCGVPTRGNTVKIVNFFFFLRRTEKNNEDRRHGIPRDDEDAYRAKNRKHYRLTDTRGIQGGEKKN